jgi:pimeloyl-ACP methyl ester carboxylesterase
MNTPPVRTRSSHARVARRLFLFLAASAFLAPAPKALAQSYAIGNTTVSFVDASRGGRVVATDVYYPADTGGSGVPVGGPAGLEYPVVSFGHGYQLTVDKYDFVWQGLVPGGYIVALPKTGGELFPSHLEFGKDLAFVIEALRQAGEDPASIFFRRVAPEAAVMGHSMGGGASFLAAKENSTITAIANFAAAETDPSAIQAAAVVSAPALVFSGSHDCVTPPPSNQVPMYDALASGCRTYISITGASHCQFAESSFLCSLGEGGCPSPTVSRSQQQAIAMGLLGPWLDYQLKGLTNGYREFQSQLSTRTDITYAEDCDVTAVPSGSGAAPTAASVVVSPNPFNPSTAFRLALPSDARVRLVIYDLEGKPVRTLAETRFSAGESALIWDGRNDAGDDVPSGVYFFLFEADRASTSGKVTLLR